MRTARWAKTHWQLRIIYNISNKGNPQTSELGELNIFNAL